LLEQLTISRSIGLRNDKPGSIRSGHIAKIGRDSTHFDDIFDIVEGLSTIDQLALLHIQCLRGLPYGPKVR
jgi:hypothetical protein